MQIGVKTGTATGSSLDHDDTPESADTYYVDQPSYCYCRGPEEGTMIACDNPDCPIEWFHTKCLRLHTLPKGKPSGIVQTAENYPNS